MLDCQSSSTLQRLNEMLAAQRDIAIVGLSNLLSGNSDFAVSRILAIPFDIGLALAGPLFVDFDEDCADEAQ